jgi:hypothetical protein
VSLTTNFQVFSVSDKRQRAITDVLRQTFTGRPGRWHVQFIGNRGEETWEVRLSGPGVETSGYVDAEGSPESLAETVANLAG